MCSTNDKYQHVFFVPHQPPQQRQSAHGHEIMAVICQSLGNQRTFTNSQTMHVKWKHSGCWEKQYFTLFYTS